MSKDGQIPIASDPEAMLTLNADRRTIRWHVPPVPLAGSREPLKLHVDLDENSVDAIILRLVRLKARMDPLPSGTRTTTPRTERLIEQAKRNLSRAEVRAALEPDDDSHQEAVAVARERLESLLLLLNEDPKDRA